jgi:hypothetical protein
LGLRSLAEDSPAGRRARFAIAHLGQLSAASLLEPASDSNLAIVY